MTKLTTFFLNKIYNRKVYDEFDECIGTIYDIYVTTKEGYPRVIGYRIKKDREITDYEFRSIDFCEENQKIWIQVRGVKEIIPRNYSYLLIKDLLKKKIVDVNGKKVVRVDDIRMAKILGEIRVLAVDSGVLAISRRYRIDKFVKGIYKLMGKKFTDSIVLWESVESLEQDKESLKLNVSYERLSKFKPADIADILEELEAEYRNKIFESLDLELASETLEELDSDIRIAILETISENKVMEILDTMPNDEVADILEEMDKENAERLLHSLEKEDADEVKRLMNYDDDLVGSIMNKDFIAFNTNITVGELLELIRETKPDDEVTYYSYFVDDEEKLQGVISLTELVLAKPESRIKDIMDLDVISVKDTDKINKSFELILKYNYLSLPVTDVNDKLCGVVIINDIIEEVLPHSFKKKIS